MQSATGRWVVAFNGEIYNFRQLAQELSASGTRFRGHSDTEVILAAVEAWGLQRAVRRLVGIFAFALWDRSSRVLHLCRDHLGVKPLYFAWTAAGFAFGSELRSLERFPGFDREIDREALTLLLRHNCIPAPRSIYRQARKLLPAHILSVPADVATRPEPVEYWSAAAAAEYGQANPLRSSDIEATDALEAVLRDAIALQMMADVPLGAFLSGGVDSSTVVALMQTVSSRPVRTFSIGFQESGFDEAQHARLVANHLGTDHTELYVSAADALAVVPQLPTIFDEPFADSSQIPTFLVSRLARQSVTVALSGDGGDELFAGYNRHVYVDRLWRRLRRLPLSSRRIGAHIARAIPSGLVRRIGAFSRSQRSRQIDLGHTTHYLDKLAGVLDASSADDIYRRLVSHWPRPTDVVRFAVDPRTRLTNDAAHPSLPGITERMMYFDLVAYLPDDILTKVDRASMAVGLEARVPLLDHRVVEFAWQVPLSQKLRNGQGKWILRQVLARHVPPSLFDRPKAGFGVPLAAWLRGPLREWAAAMLDESVIARDGFFDPKPIARAWADHASGRADRQFQLWDVLMFQAWYAERR